jgi:hypothetical protein
LLLYDAVTVVVTLCRSGVESGMMHRP